MLTIKDTFLKLGHKSYNLRQALTSSVHAPHATTGKICLKSPPNSIITSPERWFQPLILLSILFRSLIGLPTCEPWCNHSKQ